MQSVEAGIDRIVQNFPYKKNLPSLLNMVDDPTNNTPGFSVFQQYRDDSLRKLIIHMSSTSLFKTTTTGNEKVILNFKVAAELLELIAKIKLEFGALIHLSYGLPAR
jgi:hypothetical protein